MGTMIVVSRFRYCSTSSDVSSCSQTLVIETLLVVSIGNRVKEARATEQAPCLSEQSTIASQVGTMAFHRRSAARQPGAETIRCNGVLRRASGERRRRPSLYGSAVHPGRPCGTHVA